MQWRYSNKSSTQAAVMLSQRLHCSLLDTRDGTTPSASTAVSQEASSLVTQAQARHLRATRVAVTCLLRDLQSFDMSLVSSFPSKHPKLISLIEPRREVDIICACVTRGAAI